MPIYTCKLGSSDGRIFDKEMEAAAPEMLRQSLEDQGFYVFKIRKKPLQFLLDKGPGRGKVSGKDLLAFNQEFLVLLKAGLPIIQALDTILERVERGKLSEILREVREEIKGGKSLSDAMSRYPKTFPHLYIASIRAGEKTGDLPLTIRRFNDYLKRAEVLRKKFIGALVYPAILVGVAFIAITLLLVYVVPTFSQVYADAGSALPAPTQALISVTTVLRKYFLLFVGLSFAAAAVFRRWAATGSGRFRVDRFKVTVPFVGDIWRKYALASFTRTLATVIGSGIPIVESLKMSVGTLNNVLLEGRLLEGVQAIEEGIRVSIALEKVELMPPLAIRMLAVGETTGALEEMLVDISSYFEEEIEMKLGVLTTAIEPAVMLVMGLIIGTIIITMYLPVFKIAGTVG